MSKEEFVKNYLKLCKNRLKYCDIAFKDFDYPSVVRDCQMILLLTNFMKKIMLQKCLKIQKNILML